MKSAPETPTLTSSMPTCFRNKVLHRAPGPAGRKLCQVPRYRKHLRHDLMSSSGLLPITRLLRWAGLGWAEPGLPLLAAVCAMHAQCVQCSP